MMEVYGGGRLLRVLYSARAALSQVSSADAFIYGYLLRTPLLIAADALVIYLTWLRVKKRSPVQNQ
jgi:hypothetical protein